jgi:ZIP family zinc transporter
MVLLLLAACATALATGLGALPVYALGDRIEHIRPLLWGSVAGIMSVASIQGLILPGLRESADVSVALGGLSGILFLLFARRSLSRHELPVAATERKGALRALLVFGVLFVHSLPEGLALGAAWASGSAGLGLFVFMAIALQNVPEGTATAISLRDTGAGPGRAFLAAVATSAPQPVGAAAAFLAVDAAHSLLGLSFGFAAGAMLALVVVEIVPTTFAGAGARQGIAGALAGAGVMFALGTVLDVG